MVVAQGTVVGWAGGGGSGDDCGLRKRMISSCWAANRDSASFLNSVGASMVASRSVTRSFSSAFCAFRHLIWVSEVWHPPRPPGWPPEGVRTRRRGAGRALRGHHRNPRIGVESSSRCCPAGSRPPTALSTAASPRAPGSVPEAVRHQISSQAAHDRHAGSGCVRAPIHAPPPPPVATVTVGGHHRLVRTTLASGWPVTSRRRRPQPARGWPASAWCGIRCCRPSGRPGWARRAGRPASRGPPCR